MFHKISNKLMAAFLAVTTATGLVIYSSGYLAVYAGLDNVAASLHQNHLEELSRRLGAVYKSQGGWEPLLKDELWLRAIFPIANDPMLRQSLWEQKSESLPIFPEVRLLDAQDKVLSEGIPGVEFPMVPVMVDGQKVGAMGFPPGPFLARQIKVAFDEKSNYVILASIGGALLVAVLMALWMARGFLKPIHHITRKVHGLAGGDFDKLITINSRDELGTLANDINFLATALEQSQEARKRWIADIAHELRTPLTVLSAEVESAQYGIQGSSDDMLVSMEEEITQLNTLINDLRTLAQTDIGELSFHREHIAAKTLFEDYAGKAKATLDQQGLRLETVFDISSKAILFADRQRIKQLLDNLLQNSCRYTDKGGVVKLSLTREKDVLVVTWEDSAPGVPEDSLTRLFERLFRVEESRNRATGGSGLGLAICKNIVEAQQGTIEAMNSNLGGLAIRCRIPLQLA